MSCIGTAGHVDHGKSTLVTALTGIDPDRLAEEKARGMTIDLGFAWITLPSGREASIVDVPGHESFIKNMLAGVGGIDVALLVIAADEGVMPQTDEHLAILDLLRVRSGVVALTKRDLVEDDWLELVREEVAERLQPTTLAHAPIIPCSAITREGFPELLLALDAALDASPTTHRDIGRPRLPVDRVFTISGFGAVVTGALQDGALRVGQEVELLPAGRRARIRGLQTHKQQIEVGQPGSRIAVNLAGVSKNAILRGDTLTLPGRLRPTTALDVRLDVIASAPRPIAHNALLDLYVGASETPARVILLDADEVQPGESGWAQLRLAHPLTVARGDRFILRIPSPSLTIGGGQIVEAHARRHKRHDSAVLARLDLLSRGDPAEVVLATLRGEHATTNVALQPAQAGFVAQPLDAGLPAGRPDRTPGHANPSGHTKRPTSYGALDETEIAHATSLPPDDTREALADLLTREQIIQIGALYFAASEWARLRNESDALLAAYHHQYPLRRGIPREEWRSRLGLPTRELGAVLAALVAAGAIEDFSGSAGASGNARGAFVRLPNHTAQPTAEQQRAVTDMLARFHANPFTPPTRAEVDDELGPELTNLLIEQGTLVKLNDEIVLEQSAYAEAVRRILAHLHTNDRITVAEARDLLGATRKYTLALFALLDERHITARQGDDRMLGRNATDQNQAI